QTEDYRGWVSCTGPRACYDEGKRAAETLAFDFLRAHRADVRVARIFNTYGPRMRCDDGRVVSNVVCQALSDDQITIYGHGSKPPSSGSRTSRTGSPRRCSSTLLPSPPPRNKADADDASDDARRSADRRR